MSGLPPRQATFEMNQLPNRDDDDRDPREDELSRRSDAPAISPWLIIGLILMLGVGVYVVSAML